MKTFDSGRVNSEVYSTQEIFTRLRNSPNYCQFLSQYGVDQLGTDPINHQFTAKEKVFLAIERIVWHAHPSECGNLIDTFLEQQQQLPG